MKQNAADTIDLIQDSMQKATSEESLMIHNEAIRRIMDAQMWAVKAITEGLTGCNHDKRAMREIEQQRQVVK